MRIRFYSGSLKETHHLTDQGIDRRTVLTRVLNRCDVSVGDLIHLTQQRVWRRAVVNKVMNPRF
jgi:hypothetical protein